LVSKYTTTGTLVDATFVSTPDGTSLPGGACGVAISGNYIYVSGGGDTGDDNAYVSQSFLSDGIIINPTYVTVPGAQTTLSYLTAYDNFIYVTQSIFDFPSSIGKYSIPYITGLTSPTGLTYPNGTAVYNNIVYVACQVSGNNVISQYNQSNGALINPTFITLAGCTVLAINNDLIYVGTVNGTIVTYDLSGNNKETIVSTSGPIADIKIYKKLLYVSTTNGSVGVINSYDLSGNNQITLVSGLSQMFLLHIALYGSYLYVVNVISGNSVVSKYNRTNGSLVDATFVSFTGPVARGLAISGDYIYVSTLSASDGYSFVAQALLSSGRITNEEYVTVTPVPGTTPPQGYNLLYLTISNYLYVTESVSGGVENESAIGQYTLPPDTPTSVTSILNNNSAVVTWTTPLNNGGSEITSYTVISNSGESAIIGQPFSSPPSAAVTGLTQGQVYTFTVTARNERGNGPQSAPTDPNIVRYAKGTLMKK
jgi:hypothetical protein